MRYGYIYFINIDPNILFINWAPFTNWIQINDQSFTRDEIHISIVD